MSEIERWRVCEFFETHSRTVVKPGENLARSVVHEPGVFEITELVPAVAYREAVEALLKLAELHHRTMAPSKLHDPENRDWTECACKSCQLAQPFKGKSES